MKQILLGLALVSFFNIGTATAQVKKTAQPTRPAPKKAAVAGNTNQALPALNPLKGSERLVEITTPYGTMVAKLYNATPLHRDNFVKLVEQGFYDGLLFHRVMNQFMIQGGDPASKTAVAGDVLGMGSAPGGRIPAEFNRTFIHKKGALAAARDNNAEKASSNCQFYIVDGKQLSAADLQSQRNAATVTYTAPQQEIYQRIGGAPFLDQEYTVFGEVISGLEVIDKIAALQTDPNNRPVENVTMKMKLLN